MKKFVLFICIMLVFYACDNMSNSAYTEGIMDKDTISAINSKTSEKPIEGVNSDEGTTSEENQCFVYGMSNYKLYKPSRDESNIMIGNMQLLSMILIQMGRMKL